MVIGVGTSSEVFKVFPRHFNLGIESSILVASDMNFIYVV